MELKLKIKITKEILTKSSLCGKTPEYFVKFKRKMIGDNCAIALAVKEIFPDAYVNGYTISPFGRVTAANYSKTKVFIMLPEVAKQFVSRFDQASTEHRCSMSPFEFEVTIPEAVLDVITIDDLTRIAETSETLEVV
jgi:hypothetical protein